RIALPGAAAGGDRRAGADDIEPFGCRKPRRRRGWEIRRHAQHCRTHASSPLRRSSAQIEIRNREKMADSTPPTGMAALMAIVTTPTPGYGKQPLTYFNDRTLEELSDEADSVHGVGTMEAPSEDPTVEEFLSWHIFEQLDLIPDIELDSNGNILSGVTEVGTAP